MIRQKRQTKVKVPGKKPTSHRPGNYSPINRVRFVHGGIEFFNLLKELIDGARHSIHLQIYIFDADETGKMIADALINAAKRKVDICLMPDGFASQHLPHSFIKRLKEAGIRFRFFEPLLRSKHYYFGRRMHHKVIVIDGVQALVGSMNIANRYYDQPGRRAWFDLALYTEGEAAIDLHHACNKLWFSGGRTRHVPLPVDVHERIQTIPESERCDVRVRQNDWVNRKNQTSATYMEFFRTAKENITIVCSYFLPGSNFRKQLEKAARRNVKITLVLAGSSDIMIVKKAERYLYRWMSRHSMTVYEYQPVVLHTKMAIVDGHLLTLGSYNVNELSAYASIELNLDVKNDEFVQRVQKEINDLIEKDCEAIDLSVYTTGLISIKQFIRWFCFQLIRFTLAISTFYFRQKE